MGATPTLEPAYEWSALRLKLMPASHALIVFKCGTDKMHTPGDPTFIFFTSCRVKGGTNSSLATRLHFLKSGK